MRPATGPCCATAGPRARRDGSRTWGELILLAGGFHTARELLDHAALSATSPKEEGAADRVKLMTLHRSKGLEFGHVFLPAWGAGGLPA